MGLLKGIVIGPIKIIGKHIGKIHLKLKSGKSTHKNKNSHVRLLLKIRFY